MVMPMYFLPPRILEAPFPNQLELAVWRVGGCECYPLSGKLMKPGIAE